MLKTDHDLASRAQQVKCRNYMLNKMAVILMFFDRYEFRFYLFNTKSLSNIISLGLLKLIEMISVLLKVMLTKIMRGTNTR